MGPLGKFQVFNVVLQAILIVVFAAFGAWPSVASSAFFCVWSIAFALHAYVNGL